MTNDFPNLDKPPYSDSEYLKIKGKYPDFFPNSIKYSLIPESHLLFIALAILQESLKKIPKAESLFDEIVRQFDSKGCLKLSNIPKERRENLAKVFGKYTAQKFAQRRLAFLSLAPQFFPLLFTIFSNLVSNRDVYKLYKLMRKFIKEVYNLNPDKPKINGTQLFNSAIFIAAEFCHMKMGPYEYDEIHSPLRAEMARIRPRTIEGRKKKVEYDKVISNYLKHTDKYYLNSARKWLYARVLCKSVAEAERKLGLSLGRLNKELYAEPWDLVMGYNKRH
jgi:hypothetical protein